MISRAEMKWIRSLDRKSVRDKEGVFVAEGAKVVNELMPHFRCFLLIATESALSCIDNQQAERTEVVPESFPFDKVSQLESPQPIIAIFYRPQYSAPSLEYLRGLTLLLDTVQDPGNVGSIIRSAAWFGVGTIFLTPGTADPFGSKVVRATMGALGQTRIITLEEPGKLLQEARQAGLNIYGTFLHGPSIREIQFSSPQEKALLLMGNEGQGISSDLAAYCNKPVHIPPAANPKGHPESLNVAVATAIMLFHWQGTKS